MMKFNRPPIFNSIASDYAPNIDLAAAVQDIYQGLEKMEFSNKNFRDS